MRGLQDVNHVELEGDGLLQRVARCPALLSHPGVVQDLLGAVRDVR